MNIIRKICPKGLGNNPNRTMKSIENATIHTTGNYNIGANAKMHADYQYGGSGGSQTSWHYSVDKDNVYQSFDDNSECWHAGDAAGNAKSIGIEICVNDQDGFAAACNNAAQLTALLLKKYGLTPDKVVQHNYWSGKNCPAELRSGAWGITWNDFIGMVKKHFSDSSGTPILGKPSAILAQMMVWAKGKGATDTFVSLAGHYCECAANHGGVDPVVAYCQSAKETGYGKFGNVINESFCNPCGLKITKGGDDKDPAAHQKFLDWETGVKAHLDHLALYAGATGYPRSHTYDPRHFLDLCGTAKTVEKLGNWATATNYGTVIVTMMAEVMNTAVTAPSIPAAPDWQQVAFDKLQQAGIIKSPEYWKDKLTKPITAGELFAIIANI